MSIEVLTGKNTRWSYANVWEPKAINDSDKLKYSVSLIIPKSDTVTVNKIKAAIKQAYEEGQAILKGTGKSVPAFDNIKSPLRDGDKDRQDSPEYAGCYFINANSEQKPTVVDRNQNLIIDHNEVYSGVYGYASINFYAYNKNGNRGIACGLQGLMKVKDGEPLGGKRDIASMFADVETDDDEDFLS